MKYFSTLILVLCLTLSGSAQEEGSTLGQKIIDLTYSWDLEADNLNSYEGLTKFCLDKEYRLEVIALLNDIHHYDSVLYQKLTDAYRFRKDKKIKKAIEEIEKFEEGYTMKSFIHHLHEECKNRSAIEKSKEESKNDIGSNSYDGQIYIIETELYKYIHHITKRVDHIREHVEHLHIK